MERNVTEREEYAVETCQHLLRAQRRTHIHTHTVNNICNGDDNDNYCLEATDGNDDGDVDATLDDTFMTCMHDVQHKHTPAPL